MTSFPPRPLRAFTWRSSLRAASAVMLLAAVGCSTPAEDETTPTTEATATQMLTEVEDAALAETAATAEACDILDPGMCLLPFPSSRFLGFDEDTETGFRVSFQASAMPANSKGVGIDPTYWNRNDGFSPVTPILAYFPKIDPVASKLVPQGAIEASLADDSVSVLIDLTDGVRVPHWVEIDQQAPDGEMALTIMRPAVALAEGHRFAVAYRHLVDSRRLTIAPSPAFKAIRDGLSATSASAERALASRRPDVDKLLDELQGFGIRREETTLAWDFVVASQPSLSGPLLAMRDDMSKRFGLESPVYSVDEVIENPSELPAGVGRIVRGIVQVPSYLQGDGGPGSAAKLNAKGGPAYSGKVIEVPYSCVLTKRQLGLATGTVELAIPVVYGHGLLGSHREVERGDLAASAEAQNFMHCATDWLGMSEPDIPAAIGALGDLSKFGPMVDRMMQGILGQLALARALRHPKGFAQHPAFQPCNGPASAFCVQPPVSTFAGGAVFFDGNSQGGIMGAAATAVSNEWDRAVLGVPGMGYSMLLNRSTDWSTYSAVLKPAYPEPEVEQLLFGLMQMLWDRGEGSGYIHHLTDDPLPGTEEHQVLLEAAFGDHQVANVTTEIMARTVEMEVHEPALAEGRHPDAAPLYGLSPISFYPARTSALFYWDSGTLAPPPGNINPTASAEYEASCPAGPDAPSTTTTDSVAASGSSGSAGPGSGAGNVGSSDQGEGASAECADPHEDPRDQPGFWEQKRIFFESATVIDPCGGEPCRAVPES